MTKHKLIHLINHLDQSGYKQNEIVEKLNVLGIKISKSSFNIIYNLKQNEEKGKTVSLTLMKTTCDGLEKILRVEKGLFFNDSLNALCNVEDENWSASVIKTDMDSIINNHQSVTIYQRGRRPVSSKINLVERSQVDFIELGLRLRTFASHFFDENEHEYKIPIINKLKAGLNFRCYLLNPRGRFAADYFNDRAKVQRQEISAFEEMKDILERLKMIRDELNTQSTRGKMEIYLLNSYPYLHASISDGGQPNGKMFISHYMYGISRANSPVIEITRKDNPIMYKKYWESVLHTISQASKLKE